MTMLRYEKVLHIFNCEILEDLAVVDVPHGLVVPDLGCEEDGAQGDALPRTGGDVHFGVF